jgi:hypothetical protein
VLTLSHSEDSYVSIPTRGHGIAGSKLLAFYETQPIVVMARGLMDFYTIGPINKAAVHDAGRHMATVYRSGHVDYMGVA